MQINLFAWIVKIVSLKLAPGGDIIMVVKNKIFLVKEITDFFFSSEKKQGRKNCGYINQRAGKQIWPVTSGSGEQGGGMGVG